MHTRIKALRKLLGKTQKEFGECLGISRDVMANIENARVEPSESIKRLICATFGVDYMWLSTGFGEMFSDPDDGVSAKIDEILAGENEMAKAIFRAFAKFDDRDWETIGKVFDEVQKK